MPTSGQQLFLGTISGGSTGNYIGINTLNPQANFHVSGSHRYDGAGTGIPLNTGTINSWFLINITGINYFFPLYQ